MTKTSILLADDHAMFREACAYFLSHQPQYEIVGQAGTAEEAIELARRLWPRIIILDISLPGMNGIEGAKQLRKFVPGVKIIGVTAHLLPVYAKRMMQAGAAAYVTKSSKQDEMLKAIEHVLDNKKYICAEIKQAFANEMLEEEMEQFVNLTERELEIISMIKAGKSSKEIASTMHVATKTVEAHRYNILKKLKLKNTAALVNFVNEKQIVFL